MQLNPWVFALISYGTAAVITVFVALIIKVISRLVQGKKAPAAGSPQNQA